VPVDLAAFVLEITEQRVPHDRATIVTPSTPVEASTAPFAATCANSPRREVRWRATAAS